MRREAIKNARVAPGTVACALCERRMKENPKAPTKKEYQVDHIVPASEPAALIHDWNDFVDRMFVPASEHRVLCIECHQEKTDQENSKRTRKS